LIATLLITIIIEGLVVIRYSVGRKKTVRPILVTSVCANLITQSLLWIVLNFFFQHYLAALSIAEILIWMIESILLYSIPSNQLRFTEAMLLSLLMNLASLALGWLLPV